MHRKVRAFFIASAAGLSISSSYAFDVNGFRSGMSLESALTRLRDRSDLVSEISNAAEKQRSFLGTSRGKDSSEAITACRGLVTSYQYDVAGGMRAFVRLVQTEQLTRGPGAGQALSRETSIGEWSTLNFTWIEGADHKKLVYSFVTAEQVYVQHTAGACD